MPLVPNCIWAQMPYLLLSLLVAAVLTGAWAVAGVPKASAIPAGTRLTFHLDAPISPSESETGQTFSFELMKPVALEDGSMAVAGSTGIGTICRAGPAATAGHEGDVTLRLDRLTTEDGRTYAFDDQRFRVDGFVRRESLGARGVVPFVRIETTMAIQTVLLRPATASADVPHF